MKGMLNRFKRRLARRWGGGLRYSTTGSGFTVDQAGYYQVQIKTYLARNGEPQLVSHTTQFNVHANAGDTLIPIAISETVVALSQQAATD